MESNSFWNTESTVLESGIPYPESGIHSMESRIQDCPGLPYMGRSNGHVNHLGGEGRNGFDTLVNVIHQQNGWQAFMWWFSRLKFCISRLKIRRYDTKGKRKFKRMLSFLSVGKRKLFAMKLSFEEFNLTADRSAWLVLNQPRRQGFWRHLRYIPYSMIKEKYFFKREVLYL